MLISYLCDKNLEMFPLLKWIQKYGKSLEKVIIIGITSTSGNFHESLYVRPLWRKNLFAEKSRSQDMWVFLAHTCGPHMPGWAQVD